MTIKVGDKIPSTKVKYMADGGMKESLTDELFAGKKVVLFALPGAFTPTCSAKHVPGFVEHEAAIKGKGVDLIACLSVNDGFVMRAWAEDQAVGEDIVMIADGGLAFTDAVGLDFDGARFGMGRRSQRYSMIVEDGVVTSLNVEAPGEFKVSAADYLLAQL